MQNRQNLAQAVHTRAPSHTRKAEQVSSDSIRFSPIANRKHLTKHDLLMLLEKRKAHAIRTLPNGKIDIRGASLNHADLRGLPLEQFDVDGCSFIGARLDRNTLQTLIIPARLARICIHAVQVHEEDLSGETVSRPDLGITAFARFNMEGVDLRQANFKDANLSHAIFREADLRGANFTGTDLRGVCFDGALLTGASFKNAKVDGVTFRGSLI